MPEECRRSFEECRRLAEEVLRLAEECKGRVEENKIRVTGCKASYKERGYFPNEHIFSKNPLPFWIADCFL